MPRSIRGDVHTTRAPLGRTLVGACLLLAACGGGTVGTEHTDDEPSAGDPAAGDPQPGDPPTGDPEAGDPVEPLPFVLAIASPTGVVRLTWSDAPTTADELVLLAGPDTGDLTELARVSLAATHYDDATVTETTRVYVMEARASGGVVGRTASVSTASLPSTSITPLTSDLWTASNDPQLELTGSDAGGIAGFEWRLDGNTWTSSSGAAQLTNLLDGVHQLEARARDDLGNLDPTPAQYTFTLAVDFAPSLTVEGGATHTRDNTVLLTFSAQGAVEVTFGEDPELAGAFVETFQPTSLWPLSEGEGVKTIYARFEDDAGNLSAIVSATITLDTTPPSVTLTAPSDNALLGSESLQVAGEASDAALSTVTVAGAAASLDQGAFDVTLTRGDGVHLIEVVATDLAGNSTTLSRTVRVDLVPPTVSVSEPTNNLSTREGAVLVRGSASDVSATTVTVQGAAAQRLGDEFVAFAVPLTDGDNTITIVATDALGRPTTVELHVVRDAVPPTPPVTTSVTPGSGDVQLCGTAEPSARVVAAAGEQSVSADVDGDGAWCLTLSGESLFAVALTAVDAAGNTSTTAATVLDLAAPGAPSVMPVASPTSRRAIIVYGYAEPAARIEVSGGLELAVGRARLDTGFYYVGVQLKTNRSNALVVHAIDATGNRSAPQSLTVAQDEAAPAPARRLFLSQGQSQRALINTATGLPLQVVAVDAAREAIADAQIEFTVVGGGGSVAGQASVTVRAGPDGIASAPFVLGASTLEEDNLVLVDIPGNGGAPVLVEATGFAPSPTSPTRVSGVVLDNALDPVVNARVSMGGLSTVTGADGRFSLVVGSMLGPQHLQIDPALALGTKKYPPMTHVLEVLRGQDNQLGKPIFLPEVDLASTATVSATQGGVTQSTEHPELSVTVNPGQVTFPGGGTSGQIFVSPVPSNRVPMALTSGFASDAVISVLPKDAIFDPPAAVTFPNADGLAPGARVDIVSFDHGLGRYMVVGSGSVSEDGSVVRSDPGSGVRRGAWHASAPRGSPPTTNGAGAGGPGGGGGTPNGSGSPEAARNASKGADPVNLATGELIVDEVDLRVAGRGLDLTFSRTYRSRSRDTTGPLGAGWYHNFQTRVVVPRPRCEVFSAGGTSAVLRPDASFFLANIPLSTTGTRLQVEGSCRQATVASGPVELLVASGQRETYRLVAAGRWQGPAGRYSTLERVDGGPVQYILRERSGLTHHFDSFGRLVKQRDRNGNTLQLWWDDRDLLRVITDTFGRATRLSYDTSGRITRLTDHTQRSVAYSYDARGDLTSVTSPFAAGATPTNRATYQYDAGSAAVAELAHNLTRVTDALGNVVLQNRYGAAPGTFDYDKVVEQDWDAGTVRFTYEARAAGPFTRMVDRNGNVKDYQHDAAGHAIEVREYMNRGIGAQDQPVLITRHEYNAAGELTRAVLPRGNSIEYTYDEANADVAARGNLLEVRRKSGGLGGGGDLVTRFTYEPAFQHRASVVDTRGLTTTYAYDAAGNLLTETRPSLTRDDGQVLPVTLSYAYNAFGQRTKATDPEGNVTLYRYHPANDPEGDGSALTRPGLDATTGGHLRDVAADAEDPAERTSPVAPRARVTRYEYDALGRLIATIDAAGARTEMSYDARGLPVTRIDPLGHRSEWSYDGNGELVEQRVTLTGGENDTDFPGGVLREQTTHDVYGRRTMLRQQIGGASYAETRQEFDANDNVVRLVSAGGVVTERSYDERDQLVEETVAPGTAAENKARLRYDANGNLVERIDALGARRTYEYDGFDRQVRDCTPLGTCTSFDYDAAGRVVRERVTDAEGVLLTDVTLERDELGLVRRRGAVLLGTASQTVYARWRYDRNGRVTRLAHDDGPTELFTRDGTGALHTREVVGGELEAYEYDAAGRVTRSTTTQISASGQVTRVVTRTTAYDLVGRVTEESSSVQGTRRTRYDSAGRIVGLTDERGVVRTYEVDGRGLVTATRLQGATSAGGLGTAGDGESVWRFTFDGDGRAASSTTPAEGTRAFAYDAAGRLVSVTHADGSVVAYTYNARGDRTGELHPGGTGLTFTHDDEGRVVRVDATLGAGVVGPTSYSYTYDALGRMLTAQVGGHRVERQWDALGRLTSEVQDGRALAFTHNRANARTSLTYADGSRLDYTVDGLGRLDTASGDLFSGVIADDALGAGGFASRQFPNGNETAFTFDSGGRAQEIHHRRGTTELASERYVLGQANQVLAVSRLHDGDAGDVNSYDGAGRLLATHEGIANVDAALADPEAATAARRWRFAYDDANQLRSLDEGGGAKTLDVRSDGAITAVGGVARSYDARGNLQSDGVRTYAYDAFNHLAEVRDASSGALLVAYDYDALGRMIEKVAGAVSTKLTYDGGHVLELLDATSAPTWRFARYENGLLAAQSASGEAYFPALNRGGDVIAWTDASGAVAERVHYSPYGLPTFTAEDGTPIASLMPLPPAQATRPWDPDAELYVLPARHYDPKLGAFLQRDPAQSVVLGGTPLYQFAHGDPVNYGDPTGLDAQKKRETWLDRINTTLDLLGLVPGVGALPDLLSAALYGLRGKWMDAGFSAAAALPVVGEAVGAARAARTADKLIDSGSFGKVYDMGDGTVVKEFMPGAFRQGTDMEAVARHQVEAHEVLRTKFPEVLEAKLGPDAGTLTTKYAEGLTPMEVPSKLVPEIEALTQARKAEYQAALDAAQPGRWKADANPDNFRFGVNEATGKLEIKANFDPVVAPGQELSGKVARPPGNSAPLEFK